MRSKSLRAAVLVTAVGWPSIDSGSWSVNSSAHDFSGSAYAGPEQISLRGKVKHTSYSVGLSGNGTFYLSAERFGFWPVVSFTYPGHTDRKGFATLLRQLEGNGHIEAALSEMIATRLTHATQENDKAVRFSLRSTSKARARRVAALSYLVDVVRKGDFFNTTIGGVDDAPWPSDGLGSAEF